MRGTHPCRGWNGGESSNDSGMGGSTYVVVAQPRGIQSWVTTTWSPAQGCLVLGGERHTRDPFGNWRTLLVMVALQLQVPHGLGAHQCIQLALPRERERGVPTVH